MPNSIKFISHYAFFGCTGLTSVTIPNSVTSIGSSAFNGCTGITSITCEAVTPPTCNSSSFTNVSTDIPVYVPAASVEAYKSSDVWKDFTNIQAIPVPHTLTYVVDGETYKTVEINEGETITPEADPTKDGYVFSGWSEIPSTMGTEDITVTGSFKKILDSGTCGDNLTWVLTDDGTLTISGTGAMTDYTYISNVPWYSNRSNVKSIIINNGVTSIGKDAFYGCSDLTSICIPNSATSIGGSAFRNCSSLTSIEIPNSVTNIGSYAFRGCTGLTSIEIPNSVTSIEDHAFRNCTDLTSITCESVTPPTCGEGAFDNVSTDIPLYVPASSVEAYKSADVWKDFTNIQSIPISGTCGDNLTWVLTDDGTLTISGTGEMTDYTSSNSMPWYDYISSICKLIINDGVTSIGDYAFCNCSALTSITLPSSLLRLGKTAIAGCHITSLSIPNSVTYIGQDCFSNCSSLTAIELSNKIEELYAGIFYGCTKLTSISIPNGVKKLGNEIFEDCKNLVSITIPSSLTEINKNAFYGCNKLSKVEITDLDAWCKINMVENKDHITSPTYYAHHLYLNDTEVTQIEIPNGVTEFNSNFAGLINVTSIQIPNTVTSIGQCAFYDCSGLTSVTIPNSVTSIGVCAFASCTGLTSIICEAVTPPVCGDLLFYNVSTEIPVYVPASSVEAYKSADVWKDFTNIQAIPSEEPTPVPDTDISSYDNVIYTSNVKTYPGGKATLSIKLKNAAAMTGYQFDLSVPCADLSTATATRTKTRKDDNVSFSKALQADGSYRVICYTSDNDSFSGNDGEVCTITFTIPEGTAEGDYPVYITAMKLTSGGKNYVITDTIKSTLTVENYVLGDANGDESVDVGDLSSIVGYILNTNVIDGFNESAADANQDNSIDVGDLSTIVKMILGINNSDVKSRIAPKTTADNQAMMNAKSLEMKPGEDALMYVCLDNTMDVASFQFDMQLPEGFTCENVAADYRRIDENASMNYAKMNENSTRVLCYSPSNETINGTNGNIAIIKIHADNDLQAGNYEATISGIKVANADECKNVEDFTFGISVGSATGIQGVMSDNNDNTTKYDMSGRAVNKNAQGIIISNGKKYMKK